METTITVKAETLKEAMAIIEVLMELEAKRYKFRMNIEVLSKE